MKERPTPQILLSLITLLVISPDFLNAQSNETVELPSFSRVVQLENSSETSANVEFGDINGDGNPDLILAKGRHWPLVNRVVLGDGKGGILESYDLGPASNRTYSGRLADLDRDGDLDVVVSNDRPDQNLVYLNDGSGHFQISSTFGNPKWSTRNACVTDLNNDNLPDIVVANRGARNSSSNYLCINLGNGKFSEEEFPFAPYSSTTISAADFNNDGLIDLAVPHRDGGQSHVYIQTKKDDLNFTQVPFGPPNASIRMSQAADFDKDGKIDLVTIDTKRGVILYFQTTSGGFTSGTPLGNQTDKPYALSVSDLNQDGTTDIIVGHTNTPPVIQFNDGTGKTFTPVQFGDNQGAVYGFATGDFDKDGRLDIAAARSGAPNMVYLASEFVQPKPN